MKCLLAFCNTVSPVSGSGDLYIYTHRIVPPKNGNKDPSLVAGGWDCVMLVWSKIGRRQVMEGETSLGSANTLPRGRQDMFALDIIIL